MKTEYWALMGLTAALLAALLCFALTARDNSRGYRLIRRVFWALAALWISQELRWIGLNGVTAALVALLGLPGYAALAALRIM